MQPRPGPELTARGRLRACARAWGSSTPDPAALRQIDLELRKAREELQAASEQYRELSLAEDRKRRDAEKLQAKRAELKAQSEGRRKLETRYVGPACSSRAPPQSRGGGGAAR
jgi:hypothetical protein